MTFTKLLAQSLLWRGLYFITLFGVNIVLSRSLQASGSGIVFYIANTFAFVQLVAGLSLENGITFFGAGKLIPSRRLLWLCLLWTFVVAVLLLIVFHLFSFHAQAMSDETIKLYAFCFIIGLLLTTYGSNLFYTNGNFFLPNAILSCINLLFIVFVLVQQSRSFPLHKERIVNVYFFSFLVQGLFIMLAFIIKNQSWRGFALPQRVNTKRLFRYSLTVLLFNVLLFLVYRVDYYFVRYSPICSADDLGNYIQASKLGQMLLVVPQIIGSAVYPQVSSGKDLPAVSRIIALLIKAFAVVFILLFILILFLGKLLFPFLFGATFQHVQMPLLLLLPGIYGLGIVSFISNFFSGQGNVKISVGAAFAGLIVVVAGDYFFVGRYGIVAAAIISSVGYWVMFLPYLIRFKTLSGLSLQKLFLPGKEDILLLKEWIKTRKTDINE